MNVENRPGLSAIAYRIATHAGFTRQMRDGLSDSTRPNLAALTTRDEDDFSIALLDAWAMVADVLTFYQERIANESYLRTATERLSILQLARLIGYELRPGVAAGTYLAFTLDEAAGAPQQTTIDAGVKVQSIPGPGETPQIFETFESINACVRWNAIRAVRTAAQKIAVDASEFWFSGTGLNLSRGDRIVVAAKGECRLRRIATVEIDIGTGTTHVTLDATTRTIISTVDLATGVWAMRVKAAPFGHNVPPEHTTFGADNKVTVVSWPFAPEATPQTLTLDTVYDLLQADSYMVVDGPKYLRLVKASNVRIVSRAAYGMSVRATELTLNVTAIEADTLEALRATTVFAQAEPLLAVVPVDAVSKNDFDLEGDLSGLIEGHVLAFSDGTAGEIARVSKVVGKTLTLQQKLQHVYKAQSLVINANIARATHGETVQEVLGSGDAAQAHQQFTLRQTPLTCTSEPTPSGAASTLQVRVNDLLWHEVPTLYGRDPDERVFVTRADDEGRTTVRFGGRLPTGQENVKATYRKGIGLGGLVHADQLSLLMTRPLGLKSVTNPLPAGGAADPAAIDDSRRQAPLTVMTMDRVVSLRDYEDFARAYAGIAKALATWSSDSAGRTVVLTLAGPKATVISGDLEKNLLAALRAAGDPRVRVRTGFYLPSTFTLAGRIWIDRDARADDVSAAVTRSLRAQFSFDAREFGQPVALSEVMAAVHAVPGVVAADIDALYRAGAPVALNDRLSAAVSGPVDWSFTAYAELLTLAPAPLDLVLEPRP
jgi:predicted phage baseplate assembly protein